MKRNHYILVLYFLATTLCFSQEEAYRLDKIDQYSWNVGSSTWRQTAIDHYNYAAAEDFQEDNILKQFRSGSSWVNYSQYNKQYHSNDSLAMSIFQRWDSGAWKNGEQNIYTYNSHNLLTEHERHFFISSVWRDYQKTTYTYTSANKVSSKTILEYDHTLKALKNKERYFYTYDASGHLSTETKQEWRDVVSGWENDELKTFLYNTQNKLIKIEHKTWNIHENKWSGVYKQIFYVYNSNTLLTTITEQLFNASTGVFSTTVITIFRYDSNNNKTVRTTTAYRISTGDISSQYEYNYTYDSNQNLEETILKTWKTTTKSLVNDIRWVNVWEKVMPMSIDDMPVHQEKTAVYPNPFTDYLHIKTSNDHFKVDVYDVLGKRVYSQKNQHRINLINLPNGLYVVKIASQTHSIQSYKIIKQ